MAIIFMILKGLIIILSGLIAIIMVLSLIPFEYCAKGLINNQKIIAKAHLKYLFGLVKFNVDKGENNLNFSIAVCGIKFKLKDREQIKAKKNKKTKKIKSRKQNKKASKLEYIKADIIKLIYKYFKEIIYILKPKYIKIYGCYGFKDPSLTGFFSGSICIIKNIFKDSDISLQPVFEDEVLDIKGKISGQIYLCVIVYKTLRLILNKKIRKNLLKK